MAKTEVLFVTLWSDKIPFPALLMKNISSMIEILKVKNKRNSSVELLRILSMIAIVVYHFLSRNYGLYVISNELARQDDVFLKLVVQQIGGLGVPCFMFISGYYGMKFRKDRFIDMITQCFIYALIGAIGLYAFYSIIAWQTVLFPINCWWFIAAYLVVYILSPGLNYMFENLSERNNGIILIFLYFLLIGDLFEHSARIGGFMSLAAIYLTAKFIRRYVITRFYNIGKLAGWIFIVGILIKFILVWLFIETMHMGAITLTSSINNPFNVLLVGALVIAVDKVYFKSKVINLLASGSLAVYLLHEGGLGQRLFNFMFECEEFCVLQYLASAMLIYVSIAIFDLIILKYIRKPLIDRLM